MKLGILFSGGKDSCFALHKAMQNHDVKCLITVFSLNPDSFMFHTPNIKFAKKQAESIGLPIIIKKTKNEKEKELGDLKEAIKEAKEKYGLQGIVSGAIASSYQKDRVDKICKELNLESIAPLWHVDPKMTEDFLGKEIDMNMLDKLKELNKKYGVHIALEGGEAETFCFGGPIFKKKLKIKEAEKVMESEFVGKLKINRVEFT